MLSLTISSCASRIHYVTPNIDIEIPPKPNLYSDLKASYDKNIDKITYSREDAAKLAANIKILQGENAALRIRLSGVRDVLIYFRRLEKK
jgi:hypothetical protein